MEHNTNKGCCDHYPGCVCTCSCHTPSPDGEGWMKEFDSKFLSLRQHFTPDSSEGITHDVHSDVKSFITSLIKEKEEEGRLRGWNQATDIIAKAQDQGKNLEEAWEILEAHFKIRSTSERVQ